MPCSSWRVHSSGGCHHGRRSPLSDTVLGVLVSIVVAILAYVSPTHLLPEALGEHPNPTTGLVFASTPILMTTLILTVLAE